MIAHSEWKQGEIYEVAASNGNIIVFDADSKHIHGPSPMEAVLMALCSCTSVDVVSILQKKREPLTGIEVTAEAEKAPQPPRVYTRIKLQYHVRGQVSRKAVEDAVRLSEGKYCSVAAMLSKSAKITYSIELDS